MDQKNNDEHGHIYSIGFIAVVVVIGILIANFYLVPKLFEDDAGIFGDMFGGANALFSGLAFSGVIVAILLQSKELELQRKELVDTREVLKDQKAQLELQNETIKKQQFEHTFFELLKLRNNIVEKIAFANFKDQSAIWYLCRHIEEKITPPFKSLAEQYDALSYNNYHAPMNNYYRTIYSILEFVEKSDFHNDEKDYYAGILRSLFSTEELILLALNCISKEGAKNMMSLMVKYNMFKHITQSKIITDEFIAVLRPTINSD